MLRKFIILPAALLIALSLTAAKAASDDDHAHKVTIKNLKYDPAKLTIKKGETVLWINADDNDHTVISDDKDVFASDSLGNGDKFRYKFDKPGKFPYHCKYHPRMKGV